MSKNDTNGPVAGEAEYVTRREAVVMSFARATLTTLQGPNGLGSVSKWELYHVAVGAMTRSAEGYPSVADCVRLRDAVAVVYREWKRNLPLARQWGGVAERKKAAIRRAQQDEQQERAS